jgi:protein-S-isoprenylcysteine O-methyltransferase Ste14
VLTMPSLTTAWFACVPMLLGGAYVGLAYRGAAKRMADMTGYNRREKLVTKAASLAPYPFMALCVFTPLAHSVALVTAGVVVSLLGLLGLFWTLAAFVATPPDVPLLRGPYAISRNPMYVSAEIVFLGACVATASPLLLAVMVVLAVLQHGMILAEERACSARYPEFATYLRRVPRYLGRPPEARSPTRTP